MKSKLNEERRKAAPQNRDLETAKEVWKNGETTPSTDVPLAQTGPLGRVADAGDIAKGSPSPYGAEVQADVVGTYTKRAEKLRKKSSSS